MKSILTKFLLIGSFSLICGYSFAQVEPEPVLSPPAPKEVPEKQEEMIYDVVDEPAEFPGGLGALKQYMAENLRYPEIAKETGLQGKCYLKFIVSSRGEISNVKVLKGVSDCPECDKEAVRLIKSMPKWKPGKVNGKDVNSYYIVPVIFKLS